MDIILDNYFLPLPGSGVRNLSNNSWLIGFENGSLIMYGKTSSWHT